jgi:hypothetical protein
MDRSAKPEALSDMLPPQDELEADLARLAEIQELRAENERLKTTKRPDVTDPAKRPDDLRRWLEYLGTSDCTCSDGWRPGGALYGVRMGHRWVRLSTAPDCPHHHGA